MINQITGECVVQAHPKDTANAAKKQAHVMSEAITINPVFEELNPATMIAHTEALKETEHLTDEQKELLQKIMACRIYANDELHPARPVLSFKDRVMLSLGDFSMITGKAKSRKTFLLSLFVAAITAQKHISDIAPTAYPNKKRILWFDTEQSKYHTQRVFKRVLKVAGIADVPNIEFYSLRGNEAKECKKMVEHLISTGNPDNNILFVVIDGIRDLTYDINDPKEAIQMATWLLKITDEKDLHICTVLHQNKGENNHARGHLGTELTNKAQAVITVEKDKNNEDYSLVKCNESRERDFEDFAFKVNDDGLPVVVEDYLPPETKGRAVLTAQSFELTTHSAIAHEAFKNAGAKELSYKDLTVQMGLSFSSTGKSIGESKRRDFIAHWQNHGIIKHNGEQTTKARYTLCSPF